MSFLNLFKQGAKPSLAKNTDAGSGAAQSAAGSEAKKGTGRIKVLGAGCKSCHELYENVRKAVEEAGLPFDVEYITDMPKVMAYGVMTMPVVVINETVAAAGRVLNVEEVKKLLQTFA